MSNDVFISIDCNNTGRIIESYILNNGIIGLRRYNLRLNNAIDSLSKWIIEIGGTVYLSGGDIILALIGEEFISDARLHIDKYTEPEIQFSIGVGRDALSAYLALKYAKAIKECAPVFYDKGVFALKKE